MEQTRVFEMLSDPAQPESRVTLDERRLTVSRERESLRWRPTELIAAFALPRKYRIFGGADEDDCEDFGFAVCARSFKVDWSEAARKVLLDRFWVTRPLQSVPFWQQVIHMLRWEAATSQGSNDGVTTFTACEWPFGGQRDWNHKLAAVGQFVISASDEEVEPLFPLDVKGEAVVRDSKQGMLCVGVLTGIRASRLYSFEERGLVVGGKEFTYLPDITKEMVLIEGSASEDQDKEEKGDSGGDNAKTNRRKESENEIGHAQEGTEKEDIAGSLEGQPSDETEEVFGHDEEEEAEEEEEEVLSSYEEEPEEREEIENEIGHEKEKHSERSLPKEFRDYVAFKVTQCAGCNLIDVAQDGHTLAALVLIENRIEVRTCRIGSDQVRRVELPVSGIHMKKICVEGNVICTAGADGIFAVITRPGENGPFALRHVTTTDPVSESETGWTPQLPHLSLHGCFLALTSVKDCSCWIYNLKDATPSRCLLNDPYQECYQRTYIAPAGGGKDAATDVAWQRDGSRLSLAARGGMVYTWSVAQRKLQSEDVRAIRARSRQAVQALEDASDSALRRKRPRVSADGNERRE